MSVIDMIRRKQLLSSPVTVNSDYFSPSQSLDDRTGAFSLSVNYGNGSGTNMKVFVQLSNDDVNYGDITESEVVITDATGSILFDLEGSGAQFARIHIQVTAGSIELEEIQYIASQFH